MGQWDNTAGLAGKLLSTTALMGMALYTSWSRIEDNKHHRSDVLAGGAVGVLISAAVYGFQNRRSSGKNNTEEEENVSFHFQSDGSRHWGSAVMRF
jgi:hypothetical protein